MSDKIEVTDQEFAREKLFVHAYFNLRHGIKIANRQPRGTFSVEQRELNPQHVSVKRPLSFL